MKAFIAGISAFASRYGNIIKQYHPYILESFYYMNKAEEELIPYFGDFLLDSGAFTFCRSKDFDPSMIEGYIERYAAFINKYNVEKFFELDIDSVVGYEKVLAYRNKLERLTGRKSIPVWHASRGKEEFIKMCKEYPYVALGGYAGAGQNSEWSHLYIRMFPWFIGTAHKYGAKIHGLGFTSMKGLQKYHFDSVDSTAWLASMRYANIGCFNGSKIVRTTSKKNRRLTDPKKAGEIGLIEWIKFQRYADTHL